METSSARFVHFRYVFVTVDPELKGESVVLGVYVATNELYYRYGILLCNVTSVQCHGGTSLTLHVSGHVPNPPQKKTAHDYKNIPEADEVSIQ